MGPDRSRRRAGLLIVALAISLSAFGPGATATARARHAGCRPHGRILLARPQLVVWRTIRARRAGHRETVYACWLPRARPHVIASFYTGAHVGISRLRAAGHYVAFFIAADSTVTYLEVFDVSFGHTRLSEVARCEGHSACPGFSHIDAFALSPTGWVAVRGSDTQSSGANLVALDGNAHSIPLDAGVHIRDLRTRGATLRWTADDGSHPSAPLGPALGPPPTPPARPVGACALVNAADARVSLGPLGPGGEHSANHCVYESASAPRRTLEVTVRRNLTPDQFRTDEMQAEHDLTRGGRLDGLGGPANQAYYGAPVVDGVIHQRTVSFLGATELTLDMAPARSDLDLGVRRPTVIAADRLLGVPVRRR